MIKILDEQSSIGSKFIAQLRDKNIQKDSLRFRRNIERIGEILAYELSKTLDYTPAKVSTPLAEADTMAIADQVVLATVLRAGMPLHQGAFNYFDDAENAFVSAFRKPISEEEFTIEIEYLAAPSIEGKVLVICDPMLATGRSMIQAYEALLSRGTPKKVHFMGVIASKEGVAYAKKHLPEGTDFWIGVVDEKLDDHAYIVPGLGDAGDLCYGEKL